MRKLHKISKRERGKIKNKIKKILKKEKDVLFAYIFGGFVRDDSFHDIDIAVYIMPSSQKDLLKRIFEIADKIEREIDIETDVVAFNLIDPYLRMEILEGELLFTKDEVKHDFLIDYYIREYFDEKAFFERNLSEKV